MSKLHRRKWGTEPSIAIGMDMCVCVCVCLCLCLCLCLCVAYGKAGLLTRLLWFWVAFVFCFRIDVLSTLTRDKGKVLACLHQMKPQGTCDFVSGIQVAQV